MNWMKSFNDTLTFIENNIRSEITAEDITKITYTSYHHFSRMFNILSGITLNEYIRKRRLSLSALDLMNKDVKVIDVAYDYCYKTPEAFTKAFKNFHNINPSDVKKQKGLIKTFPKLSFQLIIQGGEEMEFQIIKKDNLDFIGYEIEVTTINGENFKIIPKFWQEIMQDNRFNTLLKNADELGVVGICYDWKLEENKFKYMIGIKNNNQKIDNTKQVSFKDDVFASFKAVGKLPNSIQKTANFIYQEWFPQSNYEHSSGPELEIYPTGNTSSDEYVAYYLVPVKSR